MERNTDPELAEHQIIWKELTRGTFLTRKVFGAGARDSWAMMPSRTCEGLDPSVTAEGLTGSSPSAEDRDGGCTPNPPEGPRQRASRAPPHTDLQRRPGLAGAGSEGAGPWEKPHVAPSHFPHRTSTEGERRSPGAEEGRRVCAPRSWLLMITGRDGGGAASPRAPGAGPEPAPSRRRWVERGAGAKFPQPGCPARAPLASAPSEEPVQTRRGPPLLPPTPSRRYPTPALQRSPFSSIRPPQNSQLLQRFLQ